MSEEKDARKLFAAFHDRKPDSDELFFVENTDVIFEIGELHNIGYVLYLDGEEKVFYHEFDEDSRPVLAINSDGTQLHILAGEYVFTERGIVG